MSSESRPNAVHEEKIDNGLEENSSFRAEWKPNDEEADQFPSRVVKRNIVIPEISSGWIVDHQIGLSINLLALLLLTHVCFPTLRIHTRKFFALSHYNNDTGNYALGQNDAYLVTFWVVIFTGLRAAVMDYVLMPLAQRGGVKTERNQVRFSEQAWLLVYYSFFWTLGMYIFVGSDYWLNLKNMWTNFPNREIDGLLKWYTLAQYAFWVQQFMVLFIEKRRKDHWQMFAHHIVTTALIFCSYHYHQVRVSNVILCIMDVVDLFFPTAKCLKYLGYDTACDIMFGLFMVVWVIARHIIFMAATYSVYAHSDTVSPPGCYHGKMGSISGPFPAPNNNGYLFEPFTHPEGLVCWTGKVKWGFVNALLFLQVITLIWFSMIVKVAVKVLRGGKADDSRSDDECEDEVEQDFEASKQQEAQPIEVEAGVESLNLTGRTSRASQDRYQTKVSSTSGLSIAGKKQLLDRIGCDKKIED